MIIFDATTRQQRRLWLVTIVVMVMSIMSSWWFAEVAFAAQGVDPNNPVFPPENASPFQNWEFLAALAVTLLTPALAKQRWPDWQQTLAMLVVALVVTVVGRFLTNELDSGEGFLPSLLKILVATGSYYYVMIKPLGISRAIHERTGG